MDVIQELTVAVERGRAGDRAAARAELRRLWDATTDPGHRSAIAHFMADLQDDVTDELEWDRRAMAAAQDPSVDPTYQPSLQLSLADSYRRAAHHHLAEGEAILDMLPDNDYGRLIRDVAGSVRRALASGSAGPLEP